MIHHIDDWAQFKIQQRSHVGEVISPGIHCTIDPKAKDMKSEDKGKMVKSEKKKITTSYDTRRGLGYITDSTDLNEILLFSMYRFASYGYRSLPP